VGGISTDTTGSILLLEVTHFSTDFDRSNRDHDKTQIELSESSALWRLNRPAPPFTGANPRSRQRRCESASHTRS